jgi:polysaccharide deacetylase family protein (PEP-CTERM system associated)
MIENQIILSFDVEDWQQSTWDRNLPISKRAADNTIRLLDILDRYQIKATMFVLGKFSDKYPTIVKRMAENGHEIGCHGFGHIEIFKQDYKSFKVDVEKAKDGLEQIIGEPVLGYRAPDFSIINSSLWALEVLSELGFQYDSSIFPIKHNRYGIPNWPTNIQKVILDNGGSILEFPLSTYKLGKFNIPVSGGGYFRLIPLILFSFFIKKILIKRPFIFYMHPYELNHEELIKLDFKVPLIKRIHQGYGRKNSSEKLISLLKTFPVTTFREIYYNESTSFPDFDISVIKNRLC